MKTETLEKQLMLTTKGLSKYDLQEIIDFAQFIRQKKIKKSTDNLTLELSSLNNAQLQHLDEEFIDYQNLYPHE